MNKIRIVRLHVDLFNVTSLGESALLGRIERGDAESDVTGSRIVRNNIDLVSENCFRFLRYTASFLFH